MGKQGGGRRAYPKGFLLPFPPRAGGLAVPNEIERRQACRSRSPNRLSTPGGQTPALALAVRSNAPKVYLHSRGSESGALAASSSETSRREALAAYDEDTHA
eukprot:10931461-Heterocapsa_arctica.AAC.1